MPPENKQQQSGDSGGSSVGPWKPIVFEGFAGLNTNAQRPGIEDDEMAWCDGFMPLGRNTLRSIPDIGTTPLFTSATPTIEWYAFANVGITPYMVAVLSDGSIWRVNTLTSVAVQLLGAGTITSFRPNLGLTQFGGIIMILVALQTNGYFILDSNLIFYAGTLSPGVNIVSGGTGYTTPTVTASGGSGTGATFTATQSGGVINSIIITNPGHGYHAGDTVTLTIGGGGTGASATVGLMPFGVFGSTAEVYQSRVWVAAGPNCFFSAPGSATDFSTAGGGGLFQSNDSFLRVSFTRLVQTNGFLYFVADSSINYIGGVSTSGSPPVTTFTNQNADPEIGTPYSDTVLVMSSNIVFANAFGAHIAYGGRVAKSSTALDGIYNTVPNFGGFLPSSAKSILYGKRVWVLLIPVIDPVSTTQVNKLFMWDEKRWWSTQQGVNLTFIACQEIASVLTAWGTDGHNVWQLFSVPSTNIVRTVISKLWAEPGGQAVAKASNRCWLTASYASSVNPNITFAADSEVSTALATLTPTGSGFTSGFYVSPPTALAQVGNLLGIKLQTQAEDVTIISAMIDAVPVGYRG